jgi:hypothetical protein
MGTVDLIVPVWPEDLVLTKELVGKPLEEGDLTWAIAGNISSESKENSFIR